MPYNCGFCGKEFEDIEARAKCELQCAANIRKKEEQEKKELEELERQAAEKEIQALIDLHDKKYAEYVKKYHRVPHWKPVPGKEIEAGTIEDFFADLISELANSY